MRKIKKLGSYTAKVSIMPMKATGYLKLTNITAE